jgi:hypothetical protein
LGLRCHLIYKKIINKNKIISLWKNKKFYIVFYIRKMPRKRQVKSDEDFESERDPEEVESDDEPPKQMKRKKSGKKPKAVKPAKAKRGASTWIQEVMKVKKRDGCSLKEAMKKASQERKKK